MAGDLLPALDPLLDPRSPAAQAVLNRTRYSTGSRKRNRVWLAAFFAPGAGRARGSRSGSGAGSGQRLRGGRPRIKQGGSAPSPLPSRRHSQGCTTSTDPPAWHFAVRWYESGGGPGPAGRLAPRAAGRGGVARGGGGGAPPPRA